MVATCRRLPTRGRRGSRSTAAADSYVWAQDKSSCSAAPCNPERTMPTSRKASRQPVLKDPNGGLTAAGRKAYKDSEGARLKPGVKGAADTPEKMKRKGSFLRRHFATLRGPLVDEHGKPTRLALQARAWGEPAPKTEAAAQKLADKGTRLLDRYRLTQQKTKASRA